MSLPKDFDRGHTLKPHDFHGQIWLTNAGHFMKFAQTQSINRPVQKPQELRSARKARQFSKAKKTGISWHHQPLIPQPKKWSQQQAFTSLALPTQVQKDQPASPCIRSDWACQHSRFETPISRWQINCNTLQPACLWLFVLRP